MLTTPHAVAGAAIGSLLPHPTIGVPVAVASHYALDMVPHWQETLAPYTPSRKTYIRIPIDILLAVVLVTLISRWNNNHVATIWACAIAANAPDFDSFLAIWPQLQKGLLGRYWDWHCAIQNETSSLWGILPQLAVIAVSLLLAQ